MARAPRAKVPKTSGAGVSRLSYQKGYAKGNRGSADTGAVPSVPGSKASAADDSPKGGRTKPRGNEAGGINISYGDTLPIGDLNDIEALGKGVAPKSPNLLKPGKGHVLAAGKGRSAYAKK